MIKYIGFFNFIVFAWRISNFIVIMHSVQIIHQSQVSSPPQNCIVSRESEQPDGPSDGRTLKLLISVWSLRNPVKNP